MKFKLWDMVFFRAIDHTTNDDHSWCSVEEAKNEKPSIIEGIGFFINADKDVVRITNAVVDKEACATVWMIPRRCLVEMKLLRKSR